jgi:hypothetical protein
VVAKKKISFAQQLGHAASDVANAAIVAPTGSEIGVLELAAEDELNPTPRKRSRKKKVARKKKAAPKKAWGKGASSKKAGRTIKKKRSVKRR